MNSTTKEKDKNTAITACVILASGYSKRFGSNKLLANLNSKSIFEYVISTTLPLFDKLIVVTRYNDIEKYCINNDIPVIMHNEPYKNDTIFLGTMYLEQFNPTSITFFQADQPLISKTSILEILSISEKNPDKIIRASFNDIEGSPILFPKRYYGDLQLLPENKGGNYIVKNHPEDVILSKVQNHFELLDIDTPDDLLILSNYI